MPGKWDCEGLILGLAVKGSGSWKVTLLLSIAHRLPSWLMPSVLLATASRLPVVVLRPVLGLSVTAETPGRVLANLADMLLDMACCACWDVAA